MSINVAYFTIGGEFSLNFEEVIRKVLGIEASESLTLIMNQFYSGNIIYPGNLYKVVALHYWNVEDTVELLRRIPKSDKVVVLARREVCGDSCWYKCDYGEKGLSMNCI